MSIPLEPKRANEVRDYRHDWSPFLGDTDTIASQTTTASGVTVDSSAIDTGNKGITFWLSGGTDGAPAIVSQTIVTAGGRTETEIFTLSIGQDEPVTLGQAKRRMGIEHSEDDADIAQSLRAAIATVEKATSKFLSPKSFTQQFAGFPWQHPFAVKLFKGPVISIDGIRFDPPDGGAEDVVTSFRLVEGINAELLPAYGESWPATLDGRGTVRVSGMAGYAVGEVPPELVEAVLKLTVWYQENKDAAAPPGLIEREIGPYRPLGLA